MNVTAFFVDALGSALELGVATPDDVLKHATPDVLAAHLPRPEWAKLLAACLAAPRVDARLVVDTVGVPTLCKHVPGTIVWACLFEVGQRALGKSILAPPPARSEAAPAGALSSPSQPSPVPPPAQRTTAPLATPPGGVPTVAAAGDGVVAPATSSPTTARTSTLRVGTPGRTDTPPSGVPVARASSPAITVDEPAPLGAPPSTGARPSSAAKPGAPSTASSPPATGNGVRTTGAGASTRRPQAQAPGAATRPGSRTSPPPIRRATTGVDFDIDTDMSSDWKKGDALAVDDEQLVDWAQADETSTGGPNDRKR